jgi:hypothetical protein
LGEFRHCVHVTTFRHEREIDPAVNPTLRTNGKKGHFGWPSDDKIEALRTEWLKATTLDELRKLAAAIQQRAFEVVPYLPTGQWKPVTAYHLDSDPNRLYVGGQSSGGHLAAVALTTDWPRDFGLPANMIKGGMCISGMYDLMPVRLSARNTYVEFDDATVATLSPIRHLDRLHAPVIVAYGTCETPEFQRQNCEYAAAVEAAGKPMELLVGENYNHFELPETLGNPYGLLGRAVLDLMGLEAGSSR